MVIQKRDFPDHTDFNSSISVVIGDFNLKGFTTDKFASNKIKKFKKQICVEKTNTNMIETRRF